MSHIDKAYEDTRGVYAALSRVGEELHQLLEKKDAAESTIRRLTAERLTVPQTSGWSAGEQPECEPGERILGLVQFGSEYRMVVCTQSDDAEPHGQIREGSGYLRYYLRDCAFWIKEFDFLRLCGVCPLQQEGQ